MIIQDKNAWRKEAVKRLKVSFDALRDARDILKEHQIITDEHEEMARQAGAWTMLLAKKLNNPEDKEVEPKDAIQP